MTLSINTNSPYGTRPVQSLRDGSAASAATATDADTDTSATNAQPSSLTAQEYAGQLNQHKNAANHITVGPGMGFDGTEINKGKEGVVPVEIPAHEAIAHEEKVVRDMTDSSEANNIVPFLKREGIIPAQNWGLAAGVRAHNYDVAWQYLGELKKEERRLTKMYEDGKVPKDVYVQKVRDLQAKVQEWDTSLTKEAQVRSL